MPKPVPSAITRVCNTSIAELKNSIKLLSATNAACPIKGHKKRRSVSNCRGHKHAGFRRFPRAAYVSAARRYSVVSGAIGIFVGHVSCKLSFSLLLRQFLLSLLFIQGFTPLYKLPDSCLSLPFLPLGNGNKPVYGFCDFLILFLSDTSIHGRCPPANLFR